MAKQERGKKSTPQERSKTFTDVVRMIEPPFPMILEEMERFDAIIVSREHDSWSQDDIYKAAELAKLKCEAADLREKYLPVGHTIEDHNGKPIVNPDFAAYNTLMNTIGKVERHLGLSASQRGLSGHKQAKRNEQEYKTREKVSSLQGLINKPNA